MNFHPLKRRRIKEKEKKARSFLWEPRASLPPWLGGRDPKPGLRPRRLPRRAGRPAPQLPSRGAACHPSGGTPRFLLRLSTAGAPIADLTATRVLTRPFAVPRRAPPGGALNEPENLPGPDSAREAQSVERASVSPLPGRLQSTEKAQHPGCTADLAAGRSSTGSPAGCGEKGDGQSQSLWARGRPLRLGFGSQSQQVPCLDGDRGGGMLNRMSNGDLETRGPQIARGGGDPGLEGGDRPATAGRGIPGSWSPAQADPPRDGSRWGTRTHRGGGGSGARAWHGLGSRGSIPLTAGIDSGTSLILRSSSRAGSSVSSALAAGRAALMGLGCSGGRPGAPRTARRGRAGVGQAGGRDGAGARPGGWGREGGRLNGPGTSRLPPRLLRP